MASDFGLPDGNFNTRRRVEIDMIIRSHKRNPLPAAVANSHSAVGKGSS